MAEVPFPAPGVLFPGALLSLSRGELMRFLLPLICLACAPLAMAAELTTLEKRMAQAINATVQKAGSSYASGDFEEAGAKIREAMRQIDVAVQRGSSDLYDALEPAMQRIEKAHAMLEFEGVSLPPFRRPDRSASEPSAGEEMKPAKPAEKPTPRRTTRRPTPTPEPSPANRRSALPRLSPRS